MVAIICALCGKKQRPKMLFSANFTKRDLSPTLYSARRKPDRVHYQINKCERCSLVFSSPILPPEKIAKLYRESVCTYGEQIPYLIKTYLGLFEEGISHLGNVSHLGNLQILEVGCGNGFFLKALTERGYKDVYGVEPSKPMVSSAPKLLQKRIIVDVFKKRQFPKESFDVVCTFHTLDHVLGVGAFMREVGVVLRRGGIFLAVVHDVEGLSVKLFGEKSPIFDIEHVYLFSKTTLRKLCEQHGLLVSAVFDVANTYTIAYWWRVTGLPEKLLGPLGKIPVTLKAGNIAVIARK